jgi:hypothetical protein
MQFSICANVGEAEILARPGHESAKLVDTLPPA